MPLKKKKSQTSQTSNSLEMTVRLYPLVLKDCVYVPPVFAAQSLHFVSAPRENPSEIDPDVLSNRSRDFKNLSRKIRLTKRCQTKDFEGKETTMHRARMLTTPWLLERE